MKNFESLRRGHLEKIIRSAYKMKVHREATSSEFEYWIDKLNDGETVNDFLLSISRETSISPIAANNRQKNKNNYSGRIFAGQLHYKMRAGFQEKIIVDVQNLSSIEWSSKVENPIHLSYHWLIKDSSVYLYDGIRTKIDGIIEPNELKNCSLDVVAPQEAGTFILVVTLVQENVCWFEDKGFQSLSVEIEVDWSFSPNVEKALNKINFARSLGW